MQHMGLGKFPFKDQGKEKNQPERSASTGQQNNLKAKPQRKVAKFSKTEAGEPKKLAFKLRLCNEIGPYRNIYIYIYVAGRNSASGTAN